MTFDETLTQMIELLRKEGRVSYRALKRRFALDEEYLEDLKVELIDAKHLAVDEDRKVLVWTGGTESVTSHLSVASPQSPAPGTQYPDARLAAGERRQLTVMFCDLAAERDGAAVGALGDGSHYPLHQGTGIAEDLAGHS
jgi:hypothetical protein